MPDSFVPYFYFGGVKLSWLVCVACHSHLQPSSQTAPVSPEHLSDPPRTCPIHPPSASASSGGQAAPPPATTGNAFSLTFCLSAMLNHLKFHSSPFSLLQWWLISLICLEYFFNGLLRQDFLEPWYAESNPPFPSHTITGLSVPPNQCSLLSPWSTCTNPPEFHPGFLT